jgi:PPM family protein phosphatase
LPTGDDPICTTPSPTRQSKARGHDVALITHRGGMRAANEDGVAVDSVLFGGDMRAVWSTRLDAGLHAVLVADGMGGHAHGRVASRTVLEFLARRAEQLGDEAGCEQVLHAVNEHVYDLMSDPAHMEMGTTVVGVAMRETSIVHFNVGDSRAYRCDRRGLTQLSRDDRDGPGLSHVVTQAIGGSVFPLAIAPHLGTAAPLRSGECLLLCSDGLTDMLDDAIIGAVIAVAASPSEAVERLFRRAMEAGGRDNISALIIAPAANSRRNRSLPPPGAPKHRDV